MKHKRLYMLGFGSLMLICLLLPTSVALAASLSSHNTAAQLATKAGFPAKYFSPYIEVMPDPSAAYQADEIEKAAQQASTKYFILAFILGQGCKAVWGGDAVLNPSPDPIMNAINKIRAMGGDVSISFGGAAAPELAEVCPDAASLQKQYQAVIDAYHVTHIDFDLEAAAVADANVDKRNQAIAALQKANPGLAVSYTLPVAPDGLSSDTVNLLKDAVKNGVKVDFVNIMTMDYYGGAQSKEEGDNAISAAKATERQLPSLGLSPRIGIVPMIGENDDPAEIFTLDDTHKLVAFAQQDPNVVELSMWAINRDRSCAGQFNDLGSCSRQTQQQYDFSKAFNSFSGNAAPPPPIVPPPIVPPLVEPPPIEPPPVVPPPVVPPPPPWAFPCSDVPGPGGRLQLSEKVISQDWLSGDATIAAKAENRVSSQTRLVYTYTNDTEDLPQVKALFGVMEGLGFLIIAPVVMLLGYQLMVGASTFRYAGALEGLSNVVLGIMGVAVSFQLVHMLVDFENYLTAGIVALHGEHPFPTIAIGRIIVPYRLIGEPATSYRGIVMPISRWGCAINDFMGIFSGPFITSTLGSIIPVMGGLAPLAGHVTNMFDLIRRCGEMVLAILSFVLWVQVFFRIILLNYYLLMGPLVFGCWALPRGVGQRVVRLWCKGFLTVLFLQVFQLFILTTLPLLLPPMPQVNFDSLGIMQGLLLQFPLILTLLVTVLVPRVLGASVAETFGTAGSMAGGVVVSVGGATSQMRQG